MLLTFALARILFFCPGQELIIGLDPADDLLAVFVDKVDVEGEHLSIGMNLLRQ